MGLNDNYVSVLILYVAFNTIDKKKNPVRNKIENINNKSAKKSNTHWSQIIVLGLGRKYILRLILYADLQPVLGSTLQG